MSHCCSWWLPQRFVAGHLEMMEFKYQRFWEAPRAPSLMTHRLIGRTNMQVFYEEVFFLNHMYRVNNMEKQMFSVAILIVSDTAFADPSTDEAGHVLSSTFASGDPDRWQTTETKIVGDDVLAIQREVSRWCDGENPVNLIVTSGGTGFAVKDHTPEAISPLIHRHAPGLV